MSRQRKIYRTYRDLAGSKGVSAHETLPSFASSAEFCRPVSGRQISVSFVLMVISFLCALRVEAEARYSGEHAIELEMRIERDHDLILEDPLVFEIESR